MRADAHLDIKVASLATFLRSGAAFAIDANRLAIVDAGRNLELNLLTIDADVFRTTENSFFEIYRGTSAIIAPTTHAAKAAAKHGAKNIVEAAKAATAKIEIETLAVEIETFEWITTRTTTGTADTGVTELIIALTLGFIA